MSTYLLQGQDGLLVDALEAVDHALRGLVPPLVRLRRHRLYMYGCDDGGCVYV